MTNANPVEMADDEVDDFLGAGGTGVLSLSSPGDDAPYSIPVSYGYDAAERTFYFRLAAGPDSEKGDLSGRAVSFVAHRREDDDWHSVVARGRLEETTDEDIATETLQGLQRVHIPLVDIFGEPLDDVPFEFYRLVPDELTGRRER